MIGEGSSVWPGVVIRADMGKITIGRFTCIQDNSVVHGDADVVIGDRVVIAHRALCHARMVGDRVLIGSGAAVNDGAEIGEDSLVGSDAVLMENMKVPARSLVLGVPARVKGTVEPRHTELIRTTSEHYAQKAQRYKRQGLEEGGQGTGYGVSPTPNP